MKVLSKPANILKAMEFIKKENVLQSLTNYLFKELEIEGMEGSSAFIVFFINLLFLVCWVYVKNQCK